MRWRFFHSQRPSRFCQCANRTPLSYRTSPPNPQEIFWIIIPSFHCGFGGEPFESRNGELVEGVDPYGETRFTSGTIYTDKLFTGQRDMGLGIYNYGARFYSQVIGRGKIFERHDTNELYTNVSAKAPGGICSASRSARGYLIILTSRLWCRHFRF